jgi:Anticodon binding domain
MTLDLRPEGPPSAASLTEVAKILVERGWLGANSDVGAGNPLTAWLERAAELLGSWAEDQTSLGDLLALVFHYDPVAFLREAASQDVLAREGARDVIRELANRVLDGGEIDSARFQEVIEGLKGALPQRSRELFHPLRLVLAGRAGTGELDRVILLLDSARNLPFAVEVKGTRQRVVEFCAALD